ncbi:hypothetical protein C8R47DRAFT_1165733 [Mycena vitilis]|nr:hypothetical protein C8R47DRAFT_1165733 [Mycena vitilis]
MVLEVLPSMHALHFSDRARRSTFFPPDNGPKSVWLSFAGFTWTQTSCFTFFLRFLRAWFYDPETIRTCRMLIFGVFILGLLSGSSSLFRLKSAYYFLSEGFAVGCHEFSTARWSSGCG